MSVSVLYVCTYWGVRSQIAALLTDALREPGLHVECAGFESGTIGELPRTLMRQRGLALPQTSPQTLFNFARQGADIDYVVTLCNRHTQENYSVLYQIVETLFAARCEVVHWNIPDFMSIPGEGEERIAAAEQIVQTIEDRVHDFVRVIRDRGSA